MRDYKRYWQGTARQYIPRAEARRAEADHSTSCRLDRRGRACRAVCTSARHRRRTLDSSRPFRCESLFGRAARRPGMRDWRTDRSWCSRTTGSWTTGTAGRPDAAWRRIRDAAARTAAAGRSTSDRLCRRDQANWDTRILALARYTHTHTRTRTNENFLA
jgi:hypothetical protein